VIDYFSRWVSPGPRAYVLHFRQNDWAWPSLQKLFRALQHIKLTAFNVEFDKMHRLQRMIYQPSIQGSDLNLNL
jgi:hypothetical protein